MVGSRCQTRPGSLSVGFFDARVCVAGFAGMYLAFFGAQVHAAGVTLKLRGWKTRNRKRETIGAVQVSSLQHSVLHCIHK